MATRSFPTGVKKVLALDYAVVGDGGGQPLVRVNTPPAHVAKVRCNDRFMADGVTVDNANGGWFALDLTHAGLEINPRMIGAPNNGTDHDDAALVNFAQIVQLGICKRIRFKGAFRVFPTVASASICPFYVYLTDGLTVTFENATITATADQTASNWTQNVFWFDSCKRFRGIGVPKFIGNYTKTTVISRGSAYGVIGMQFYGNCSEINLDGVEGEGILQPLTLIQDTLAFCFRNAAPTVWSKGSAYQVGDYVTVPGGPGSDPARYYVASVDGGGGVVSLGVQNLGYYPSGSYPTIGASETGYATTGGSGSGLRLLCYAQRWLFQDTQTVRGTLGKIKARQCYYALCMRNSGDYVTAWVDADYGFRASFVYGDIIEPRIHTTVRHMARTAIPCGQAQQPMGTQNGYFYLKQLPVTETYSVGDCLIRPTFNAPWPTDISLTIEVDLDYRSGPAASAANFLEVGKYNFSTGGKDDDTPRGHRLSLNIKGKINGTSGLSGGAAAGTHISTAGRTWSGDRFHNWNVALDIIGGGNIVINPAAFSPVTYPEESTLGIHFDVVNPDGYVVFNDTLTGTGYLSSQVPATVSERSQFKNRYAASGGVPMTLSSGSPWMSFTPTLLSYAGGAFGAGNTITGRYRRQGTSVSLSVKVAMGASGKGAATQGGISLPVPAVSDAVLGATNRTQGSFGFGDIGRISLNEVIVTNIGSAMLFDNSTTTIISGTYEAAPL